MGEVTVSAYLLHSRPWRDSSRIMECYALELGRIGVVAKGSRRPGRRGAATQSQMPPFTELNLHLGGRGELYTLRQAEQRVTGNLCGQALYYGMYLNEILLRLIHRHDPDSTLYRAYADAIAALARGQVAESVLREFELVLLQVLGFEVIFACAETGNPLSPDGLYRYLPDVGFTPVASSSNAVFSGHDLLAVASRQWHAQSLRCAKRLCRLALAPHLGQQPLRSRELFRPRER